MTEIKQQLTELQLRTLLTAQVQFDQTKLELDARGARLEEVRGLILDAHGLSADKIHTMSLNAQTGELTVTLKDEVAP